jgi:hypothetical protein
VPGLAQVPMLHVCPVYVELFALLTAFEEMDIRSVHDQSRLKAAGL